MSRKIVTYKNRLKIEKYLWDNKSYRKMKKKDGKYLKHILFKHPKRSG